MEIRQPIRSTSNTTIRIRPQWHQTIAKHTIKTIAIRPRGKGTPKNEEPVQNPPDREKRRHLGHRARMQRGIQAQSTLARDPGH